MEMAQITALVERLTDDQLMEEIQRPSGMAPLQVVMGEIQRRAALRGGKPRGYAQGGRVESERSRQLRAQLEEILPAGTRFTSGYRTPEHNAKVGGVPNSWHVQGDAWDFVNPDLDMDQVRGLIAQAGLPAGELLNHDAGSGMHFHYSPEGQPLQGGEAAPPPPDAPSLPGGYPNPQNLANQAIDLGGRIGEAMGLPGQAPSLTSQYGEIAGLMPEVRGPFDAAIARLQQNEADTQRANRGRSLMEMGLGMMSAQTPNFMSALAAGGQAGLQARDRIRQEERNLMQGVIATQLGQSQAEQQQARAILESASGQTNSTRNAILGAMGMGSEISRTGALSQTNAADMAGRERLQTQQLAASKELAQMQIAASKAIADAQIAAGRYQDKSPEEREAMAFEAAYRVHGGMIGQRMMAPATNPDGTPKLDRQGNPTMTLRVYTAEDALRDATTAARIGTSVDRSNSQQQGSGPVQSGGPGPRIVSVSPVSGD